MDRRDFLSAMAATFLLAGIPAGCSKTKSINLPLEGGSPGSLFETFVSLSRFVTGLVELDMVLAEQYCEIMSEEPYGPKHIRQCYLTLLELSGEHSDDSVSAIVQKIESEGERWFLRHLATTWFTGIYYFGDNRPLVITRQGAIMWGILDKSKIGPGTQPFTPEEWGSAPVAQV